MRQLEERRGPYRSDVKEAVALPLAEHVKRICRSLRLTEGGKVAGKGLHRHRELRRPGAWSKESFDGGREGTKRLGEGRGAARRENGRDHQRGRSSGRVRRWLRRDPTVGRVGCVSRRKGKGNGGVADGQVRSWVPGKDLPPSPGAGKEAESATENGRGRGRGGAVDGGRRPDEIRQGLENEGLPKGRLTTRDSGGGRLRLPSPGTGEWPPKSTRSRRAAGL
ncbi:translation initiation factor IF-2-like [Dromiciops gliroides]|uniref:translation initiation factor IF-2-like n=1 Tax=Dromiciops gliroides TaxID=33562 RepID=UPI001CC73F57|nr:translation initiation factor IF-2-like [Dromiciops gliroides]